MKTKKVTHLNTGLTTVIRNGKIEVYNTNDYLNNQKELPQGYKDITNSLCVVFVIISALFMAMGITNTTQSEFVISLYPCGNSF